MMDQLKHQQRHQTQEMQLHQMQQHQKTQQLMRVELKPKQQNHQNQQQQNQQQPPLELFNRLNDVNLHFAYKMMFQKLFNKYLLLLDNILFNINIEFEF